MFHASGINFLPLRPEVFRASQWNPRRSHGRWIFRPQQTTGTVSYRIRTCVCDFIPLAPNRLSLVLASIPISRHLIQKHISLHVSAQSDWWTGFTCSTVYWKWHFNRQAIHDLPKSAQRCIPGSIPAIGQIQNPNAHTRAGTMGWIAFAPVVSPGAGIRTLTIFLSTNRLLSELRWARRTFVRCWFVHNCWKNTLYSTLHSKHNTRTARIERSYSLSVQLS